MLYDYGLNVILESYDKITINLSGINGHIRWYDNLIILIAYWMSTNYRIYYMYLVSYLMIQWNVSEAIKVIGNISIIHENYHKGMMKVIKFSMMYGLTVYT